MFGWSIIASACRSCSKRAMTSFVSMPSLMIFSATRRRTGLLLLGHPDHAETAFADLLEQLVIADGFAGLLRFQAGKARLHLGSSGAVHGSLHERLVVERGEQLLHAGPEVGPAVTGGLQVGRTFRDRKRRGDVEDFQFAEWWIRIRHGLLSCAAAGGIVPENS